MNFIKSSLHSTFQILKTPSIQYLLLFASFVAQGLITLGQGLN